MTSKLKTVYMLSIANQSKTLQLVCDRVMYDTTVHCFWDKILPLYHCFLDYSIFRSPTA